MSQQLHFLIKDNDATFSGARTYMQTNIATPKEKTKKEMNSLYKRFVAVEV